LTGRPHTPDSRRYHENHRFCATGFPASTLWSYRLALIGTEAVLWGTIGVVFGALANRKRRF
jgi:hypothetical protein